MNYDYGETDAKPFASPALDQLMVEKLGSRARNALKQIGIRDEHSLLKLGLEDLAEIRHCGRKTEKEILEFRDAIDSGKYELFSPAAQILSSGAWLDEGDEALALNALSAGLSSRAQTTLARLGVNSLQSFLDISLLDIPGERGTGAVTSAEIIKIKSVFMAFLEISEAEAVPRAQKLDRLCAYIFRNFSGAHGAWQLDPSRPLTGLRAWAADTARGTGRIEQAFLLRMGLAGQPAMTLEKAGSHLGLTRERVRQLNREFALFSKWIVAQRRLDPLIARMAELCAAKGGRIARTSLLDQLGQPESSGEELQNATRLLDFISTFEPWQRHGLACDKWDVFLI
jgi:hypothetical protein